MTIKTRIKKVEQHGKNTLYIPEVCYDWKESYPKSNPPVFEAIGVDCPSEAIAQEWLDEAVRLHSMEAGPVVTYIDYDPNAPSTEGWEL